jgi:hypothetical protein
MARIAKKENVTGCPPSRGSGVGLAIRRSSNKKHRESQHFYQSVLAVEKYHTEVGDTFLE